MFVSLAVFGLVRCEQGYVVDLSWCVEVGDAGVEALTQKCTLLRSLVLIGLHSLTTVNAERLPLLELLDVQQCSFVSDEELRRHAARAPGLVCKNYYGDAVSAGANEGGAGSETT